MSELKTQNIEETNIAFGKIANGLQSAASDHILGIAKDIYDTKQKAYQEDINEYLLNKVDGYTGGGNCDCEDITNAILEKDILTEVTIGGIEQGVTLEAGMTFTEFVERLFTIIYYGSIGDISRNGYVKIGTPEITVEKYENNKWVSISNNAIVKENTQVRVIVSNIPESILKDYFGVMYKSGNVLAYGWLKSVDGGEPVDGSGNCEIGATYATSGNDNLTIPIHSGCFSSLSVNSDTGLISFNTTTPNASNTSTTQAGQFNVCANSKSFQIKSDKNYTIYAKSSKTEDVSEIPEKRIRNVVEGENIGQPLSSSATSNTFTLNVEGWGLVPSNLKTPGSLIINPPTIKVINNTEGGKEVNSGDPLNPNHKITINVELNGNSSVSGASAYLEKSSSTFQYGWEKLKNDKSEGKVVNPTGNCVIGTTWSEQTEDTLVFSGTPTGAFKNMKISSDNKTITFTTQVGEVASNFKVKAKSGEHVLLSDAKYDIYALSSIQSSGESNQMNNTYSIANGQVLKTFGSIYSGESSFSFSIKDNPFGIIPAITINGAVSIGAPTIKVTKTDGTNVEKNQELDPRDKINVKVTIPKSQITTDFSAVYKYSGNYLKYGWKLDKDGIISNGEPGSNCGIGINVVSKEGDKLSIKNANGVFKDRTFSGNEINWSNITASEASTLEVEAIAGRYEIYPDANYILYSLSELGDTKDSSTTKTVLNKSTSIRTISGIKSSSIFNFRLLEELWSNIPTLTINNCAVSIAKPTIKVTKHGETTALNSLVELNPTDTLDIEITLNESKITTPTAYYQPNESSNYLKYGWKLYKSGTQIASGDKNAKCTIELTTTKDSTDTHTFNTKSGAFSGLSTSTLKLSNVSVGDMGGTLKITSKPSTYTVSPKYDYRIYALSSFDNFNDSHSSVPGSKQYSGSAQYDEFIYTVKVIENTPYLLYKKYTDFDNFASEFEELSALSTLSDDKLMNNYNYIKSVSGESIGGSGYYIIFSDCNVELLDAVTNGNIIKDWEKIQIAGRDALYGELSSQVKYQCKIY